MKAIIFDADGTLADTERNGHFPACNEAFAGLDCPIRWTWTEYKWLLNNLPGTERRMYYALEKHSPDLAPAELEAAVARLAARKRQIYLDKYVAHVPLRAGVANLINEGIERGIQLAIVSLSHEEQIRALLRYQLHRALEYFNPILGKLAGQKHAPDSPLYRRCLAELRTSPAETLVLEDSEGGFRAAQTAGLSCAVIYNEYTFGHNFTGAALVARSLEYFNLEQLVALCLPASVLGIYIDKKLSI